MAAGAVAAVAVAAKATAWWGIAAVALWLALRHRRRAAQAVAAFVATGAGLLALTLAGSGGRVVDNFVRLSASGIDGPARLAFAPVRFVDLGLASAPAAWMLLAVAVALAAWRLAGAASVEAVDGAGASGRGATLARRLSAWDWALMVAAAIAVMILADVGADGNHLLGVAALVVGSTALAAGTGRGPSVTRPLLAVLLGWGMLATAASAVAYDAFDRTRDLVADPAGLVEPRPLHDELDGGEAILSEDPTVPVLHGQRPVILDAFMLRALAEQEPDLVAPLEGRIRDGDFDVVVLRRELGDPGDQWWRDRHLGPAVARAIDEAYALDAEVDGYYLYRPR